MTSSIRHRDVRFFEQDGYLVRTVTGRGRSYTHRCPKTTFETVAHAIEETPADGTGTTLELLAKAEDLPFTQVNVALEFLKERGIVHIRHRRNYPATSSVHLDAMVEFHALAEEAKPA